MRREIDALAGKIALRLLDHRRDLRRRRLRLGLAVELSRGGRPIRIGQAETRDAVIAPRDAGKAEFGFEQVIVLHGSLAGLLTPAKLFTPCAEFHHPFPVVSPSAEASPRTDPSAGAAGRGRSACRASRRRSSRLLQRDLHGGCARAGHLGHEGSEVVRQEVDQPDDAGTLALGKHLQPRRCSA